MFFSIKKVIVTGIFVFLNFTFLAQSPLVEVYGNITDDNRDLVGVLIQVTQGTKVISSTKTDPNGEYSFQVPLGGEYLAVVSRDGYISKRFTISTYGVPAEKVDNKFQPIGAAISLFPKVEGVDYSLLNQPMMKFSYNAEFETFEYDKAYQKYMSEGIEAIKQAEKDIRNREKEKEAKFASFMKEADRAFGKKEYAASITNYQEALKLKPKEIYPAAQISNIKKLMSDAEAQAKLDADAKAKLAAELAAKKAAEDAAAKAKADAEALAKAKADKELADKLAKEKAAADAKAKAEADARAKADADALAKKQADDAAAKAKADAEALLRKQEQDALAKKQADEAAAKAKLAADAKAKADADAKAKADADALAAKAKADKELADKLAREKAEAENKAKADAAAKAKADADALAKAQTEKEKAEKDAKAKAEADLLAKKQADDASKAKAEKELADKLAKEKLDAVSKANADALAKKQAQEAADKQAAEAALAKAKAEKEKADKLEAEKSAANAKALAEAKAKADAEALAKKQAEDAARSKSEKALADALAKEKADALAKAEAENRKREENDRLAKEKITADASKGKSDKSILPVLGDDPNYKEAIRKGDNFFALKRYIDAKASYEQALTHKGGDTYAKDKLMTCEKMIAADAAQITDERQKQLLAKYPEGVTEETLPGDGVVIIKRVLVKERKAWVYEKKIFNWGGLACFRDGIAITELVFEQETKR